VALAGPGPSGWVFASFRRHRHFDLQLAAQDAHIIRSANAKAHPIPVNCYDGDLDRVTNANTLAAFST
jgi:hypothetical protein